MSDDLSAEVEVVSVLIGRAVSLEVERVDRDRRWRPLPAGTGKDVEHHEAGGHLHLRGARDSAPRRTTAESRGHVNDSDRAPISV